MERPQKSQLLLTVDEDYVEAQRLIQECREKKGTELHFFDLKLRTIPPEIAELDCLETLSVGSESYDDKCELRLPPEMGNLKRLRSLTLKYDIPEIPDWVGTLDNLEILAIFNDDIKTIPAAVSHLKKLRELSITGDNITSLPGEIGDMPSLRSLYLWCPQLKTLPESFAHLKKLSSFNFAACNVSTLPGFICGWTELARLEIYMEITEQYSLTPYTPYTPSTALKSLPRNIGNLKKLQCLYLINASITQIPDSLADCPLEHLSLSGNFKTIPEAFGNLLKLKNLSLYSPKLETLPDSLGRLSSLEFLYIESDRLSSLPQSFCALKKLEALYLITSALKTLPDAFGDLTALIRVYIFSGALTTLPESMGNLRNLKYLGLDVYNLKEFPHTFSNLSYITQRRRPNSLDMVLSGSHLDIKIGRKEPELPLPKEKINYVRDIAPFREMALMGRRYRRKLHEKYSIKKLESLLRLAPGYSNSSEDDKELFEDLMKLRYYKLNLRFKWTEENIQQIIKVSGQFVKAWEDGFLKAKTIISALYEKERDKYAFQDKYEIEIILHPEILNDEDKNRSYLVYTIYDAIIDYLDPDMYLAMRVEYDPVTKNEDDFWQNSAVCRDKSRQWTKLSSLGNIALADYYICRAIYVLHSYKRWAFQDILKINRISTEIKVNCKK